VLRCILRHCDVLSVRLIPQDLRALNLELFTLPSHGEFLGNHHFLVYQDDVAVCFASAPYCCNPGVLCLQKTLPYGRKIFETSNGMQFAEYRVAMVNGFKPTVCIGTAGSQPG
jgi:hypothetical protein